MKEGGENGERREKKRDRSHRERDGQKDRQTDIDRERSTPFLLT